MSSQSHPSGMGRHLKVGSTNKTSTTTTPSSTTTSTLATEIIYEADCSCPYCYVRSRNRQKFKFTANAASVRTTTNGKNYVSLPISYADIPGSPTPLINLRVKTNNKNLSTLRSLPDTGASIDCVDAKFVKKHNIEIIPDTTKMIELISAEGKAMAVHGTCKLQIQNIGGHGYIETIALVCPNLSHNFLCSWITQKKLNLLHKGWPFVRLYNASSATLTEVPTTPRRLRPKTKTPDKKIPEWPKPE